MLSDNKEPIDQKPELTQEQKMLRFLEQHQQHQQQQHLQQQPHQGSSEREEERDTPGQHTCPYCNFCSSNEARLHAHVTSNHQNRFTTDGVIREQT